MADPTPPRPDGRDRPGRTAAGGLPRWSVWLLLATLLVALALPSMLSGSDSTDLSYSELLSAVEAERVSEIDVNNETGDISGELDDGTRFTTTGPVPLPDPDLETLRTHEVKVTFHTPSTNFFLSLLPLLLPVGLLIAFFVWMQRRAQGQMTGIMNVGRSKAKPYSSEHPDTTFDDVAGYEGVKREITEVVDFLKTPDRFTDIGAKIPKGILLVGPPGTGKTMIARAVAGEAGVPFLSVTGSDFMEMFVGVGASRVRDLFQTARKMAPAIVFIDEIDSIGRKRGAGLGGGHDEREQTLNQMLSEMDGFEQETGVVMMAATNRPDILDPALLRPGRFDRQVTVPLPEHSERLAILEVHSADKHLDGDVDLDTMAKGTPGMSGAELANLVNEAALGAVRRGAPKIAAEDFEMARDRILMGARRESMVLSDAEKEAVAFHEAGHAVAAHLCEHADELHKVTILPTGMALGVTQQLPEERHLHRVDHLEDSLVVRLGGRLAEEIVFGVVSTGASNDLVGATQLASRMVRDWGMSDRIGPMAWGADRPVFLGEDMVGHRDYSDETARIIDEEIQRILVEQLERGRALLLDHRDGLERVARALLEHETVTGAEVAALVAGEAIRLGDQSSTGPSADGDDDGEDGSPRVDEVGPVPGDADGTPRSASGVLPG